MSLAPDRHERVRGEGPPGLRDGAMKAALISRLALRPGATSSVNYQPWTRVARKTLAGDLHFAARRSGCTWTSSGSVG